MATVTETEKRRPDREKLIADLNGDLSREYQAIIAYVVYSQVLKGAEYMNIATELEEHAEQELQHALTISQANRLSRRNADRDAEAGQDLRQGAKRCSNSISTTRTRPSAIIASAFANARRSASSLMAEQIREILVQEQDHQIDLATALGKDVPVILSRESR